MPSWPEHAGHYDPEGLLLGTVPSHAHADHSALTTDDHTQYALLAGRAGGQTLYGGTAAGNALALIGSIDAAGGPVNITAAGATATTWTVNTSGVDASQRVGILLTVGAGYTGTGGSSGIFYDNLVVSANTTVNNDTSTYSWRPSGNRGAGGAARATVAAINTGLLGLAGGGDTCFGVWGAATVDKVSGTNIGVMGSGLNSGAGGVFCGGYFTCRSAATLPTFENAALIADNATTVAPIFLGRDNGTTVFAVLNGGPVGIGTATVPHGAVGYALLALEGPNASASGPHVQITTASDDYPLLQWMMWSHDNINFWFDCYYDGAVRSSDAGSSFAIRKVSDLLQFQYGVAAAGSAVTMASALNITNGGIVLVGGITAAFASERLAVQAADNGTCLGLRINAAQAAVTGADVFAEFRSTTGQEGSITGSGVAGVIAYNTFTGAHYAKGIVGRKREDEVLDIDTERVRHRVWYDSTIPPGTVLVALGTMSRWEGEDTDHLPEVGVSQQAHDRRVYGVFGGHDRDGDVLVLAVGAGKIRVCTEGGTIRPGDLLCSSSTPGVAMRWDGGDVAEIVAKARQTWDGTVETLIACTLMAG